MSEWVRQNGTETASGGMDWRHVERVVFIDSTWVQTKKIVKVIYSTSLYFVFFVIKITIWGKFHEYYGSA